MKNFFYSLILALYTLQASATPNDFILQTRTDEKSINFLIEKTRLIIANAKLSDGTEGTVSINPDPIFKMGDLSTNPIYQETIKAITDIFHLEFKDAQLRIRIPKLYYKVHSIYANPQEVAVNDPVLSLKVKAGVQGVDIGFPEGLQIDFMIPDPVTSEMGSYLTATVQPSFVEVPATLEPVQLDVSFETVREEKFRFNLKNYDLSQFPNYIRAHLKDIKTTNIATHAPLSADHITVNPITVRFNQVQREIRFDEFKSVVQDRMNDIISLVFVSIGDSLKGSLGDDLLKTVFSSKVSSDLVYKNSSLYTRYATQSFSQPAINQIALNLSGELCSQEDFARDPEGCVSEDSNLPPIRTISAEDKAAALNELKQKISNQDADIGLSVSEEYINRLLKTTIDANLWAQALSAHHLELGPKGTFIVLNENTKTPELYVDLIFTGQGWFEKIFINKKHPLHFPIRMSTSLHFEANQEGTPTMSIVTEKVLSTRDEILKGIPEYGLDSHLFPIFKKLIAKKIISLAHIIEGRSAISMELPIFKNVGLEKTWYECSQFGRVNLYFKL